MKFLLFFVCVKFALVYKDGSGLLVGAFNVSSYGKVYDIRVAQANKVVQNQWQDTYDGDLLVPDNASNSIDVMK